MSTAACASEDDGHGITRVELLPAGTDDPFIGTSQVRVTLNYNECLTQWYREAGTDYQQEGVKGAEIFAEFEESLCTMDTRGVTVDCDVASMQQMDTSLRILYDINDSALAGKEIPWGPLPCESLTSCDSPTVDVRTRMDIQGLAGGTPVWEASGLSQPQGGCDQGAPITIKASTL